MFAGVIVYNMRMSQGVAESSWGRYHADSSLLLQNKRTPVATQEDKSRSHKYTKKKKKSKRRRQRE